MAEFNTTADTLCNEEPHSLPQEAKPDIDAIEPCVGSAPCVPHTHYLCNTYWAWFSFSTDALRTSRVTSREEGDDGVVRTVEREESVEERHSLVLSFDAAWNMKANRYATSDLIIADGDEALNQAIGWETPLFFTPSEFLVDSDAPFVRWMPGRDTVTLTMGFNSTLSADRGCAGPLAPTVYVGVRCSYEYDLSPCEFELSAQLIPRLIADGSESRARIGAGETHLYVLSLGAYDVFKLSLTRQAVITNASKVEYWVGGGLSGSLLALADGCPTEAVAKAARDTEKWDGGLLTEVDIGATSPGADLDFFCTTSEQAALYGFGVEAAKKLGPFGMPFFRTVSDSGANCQDGYVGPDGYPMFQSNAYLEPGCNPNGPSNELKAARGEYSIAVEHRPYAGGELARREVRPGCVAYGQWRRYTMTTAGGDNVYLQMSRPVSGLYLRAESAPTKTAYDAKAGGSSDALAHSPCEAAAPTVWHIGVYLEEESEFNDLVSTEFNLTAELQPMRRAIGGRVASRANGGDGYACCGAMKYFVAPVSSAKASLRVALNVTQGAIRAVYLKSQTCPVFPDDIEGEQCRGLCHMTWYTEYDKYSGELIFKTSDVTTVPIGDGEYPDKRASGEWFIGIHASDLRTTEFELEIAEVAADTSGDEKLCDRFGRYDCDNSMWKVPPDLPTATLEEGAESAAARGAHAAPSVAAVACVAAAVFGRRRRRH